MAPPDSDDEDGEKKKGDGKKKKGDGKNKRKRNDDTIGSQEADSNDSKTTKKLRKKISKILTIVSESIEALRSYNDALKSNPEDLKLIQMIRYVSHVFDLVQNLRKTLPREVDMEVIEKNPFDVYPSSSESVFEGFIEPQYVAVGNVDVSKTTKEEMIDFFGGDDIVSDAIIHHESNGCLVVLKAPKFLKEALKKNGEVLHDRTLYITPQHNDRTVYYFTGYSSDWSESKIRKRFTNVFTWGNVLQFYFPANESFGYALVTGVEDDRATYESIRGDIHNGFSIRAANLRVRVCRAHLDL